MKLRLKSRTSLALVILGFVVLVLFLIVPREPRTSQRTRETVLRTDLRAMRDAIDHYTLDKQQPPQSLQDLVDARYLRSIPIDPITLKPDWVPGIGEVELSPNQKAIGLYDIHSNSKSYSTW